MNFIILLSLSLIAPLKKKKKKRLICEVRVITTLQFTLILNWRVECIREILGVLVNISLNLKQSFPHLILEVVNYVIVNGHCKIVGCTR